MVGVSVAVAVGVAVTADATQVFSRIETLPVLEFATARSGLPSPLKSPTVTEEGFDPAEKLAAAPKLGVAQDAVIAVAVGVLVRVAVTADATQVFSRIETL